LALFLKDLIPFGRNQFDKKRESGIRHFFEVLNESNPNSAKRGMSTGGHSSRRFTVWIRMMGEAAIENSK
jgi:hypothetical protein